ncbi:uroporphyrinogen-III synthase [Arthrobacter sp. LAPM80]|uniref:uroporphyrinogen-III synthase n=1 Tax=Arthrobacter sp. LAPM80 TaxID=3141788 RepID=UPI00398BA22C
MTLREPAPGAGPLTGLRVAVTRSLDRAGGLLFALTAAGAETVLVPVIDFEVGDHDVLGAALHRLAEAEYAWLVISSITTVRALKQWCEAAGTSLIDLIPAGTKVATIGPTSVAVLAAEGIHANVAPVDVQSAAGLVGLWPGFDGGNNKVLLPQSNLAEATLTDGIRAKGWDVESITAYKTVDYPADPAFRLTAAKESRFQMLTPDEAAGEMRAGAIDAVVLASGSAAARVAATMAPLPSGCLVVAIGQPTRDAAERLGMSVAATAEHPTPEGIVAALARARTLLDNQ